MATDITADVHALVRDLLPILLPGATFDDASASVVLPLVDGRARVSTASLVAACGRQPNHLWPRTVDEWLTSLRAEVGDALPSDDAARPERLRVRVTPRGGGGYDPSTHVVLPFGSHFDVVVLVDFPTRTRPLRRAEATELSLDPERAVELAIRQTIANELRHLDTREHDVAGTPLRMVARDGSPYVSAVLLSVGRFAGGAAESGVLVAVPRHSTVLLHRVVSDAALDFVPVLASLTASMHSDAADSCSDRVFWWVDGTLHLIELEQTDDPARPRVTLPAALTDLVRQLPGHRR
jgi:hypothetical protein